MTHLLVVIDTCAKYGKPMSNQKIVVGQTRKHFKNLVNLTLRSNVLGTWMTHYLMVIQPCAKYGTPMSNQIKLWAGDTNLQTDGQWFLYTPWTIFKGGGIIMVHIRPPLCLSSFEVYFTHLLWKFIM